MNACHRLIFFLYFFLSLLCTYVFTADSIEGDFENNFENKVRFFIETKGKRLREQAQNIEQLIILFQKLQFFFTQPILEEKIRIIPANNALDVFNDLNTSLTCCIQFLSDMLYLTQRKKAYMKITNENLQLLCSQLTHCTELTQDIHIELMEEDHLKTIIDCSKSIIENMYILFLKKTVKRSYEVEIECIKMRNMLESENKTEPVIKKRVNIILTHHKIQTLYNDAMVYISFHELQEQLLNEISSFDKEYRIGEIIIFCTANINTREWLEILEKNDYFILPLQQRKFIVLGALYPFKTISVN